MTFKKTIIPMICLVILLTGCQSKVPTAKTTNDDTTAINENSPIINLLNKDGMTVEERYMTPQGFDRIIVDEDSFGAFLRLQRLKPYGEKVLYYNGKKKSAEGVYDSVFDVEIGDRDLHQCADAIMLLRAEYLYSQSRYDEISFNFVSGFTAEYSKWMEGYRIRVEGNDVSYYKATDPSDTYQSFRKYMDIVFAYASTLSMEKELVSVSVNSLLTRRRQRFASTGSCFMTN